MQMVCTKDKDLIEIASSNELYTYKSTQFMLNEIESTIRFLINWCAYYSNQPD